MSIYNHDSPFIPARKCPGDPIAKYPSHQIINNSGNTSMKTQKNSPQNK